MSELPQEDHINVEALKGESRKIKSDLQDPKIYTPMGEEQLLLWIEEIDDIRDIIQAILRNKYGQVSQ